MVYCTYKLSISLPFPVMSLSWKLCFRTRVSYGSLPFLSLSLPEFSDQTISATAVVNMPSSSSSDDNNDNTSFFLSLLEYHSRGDGGGRRREMLSVISGAVAWAVPAIAQAGLLDDFGTGPSKFKPWSTCRCGCISNTYKTVTGAVLLTPKGCT
jgi:hypothetical protein